MTISAGDIIYATDYNSIQSTIYSVITTRYGYVSSSPATAITVGEAVTAQHWLNLQNDINQCTIHQTNQAVAGLVPAVAGELITASYSEALRVAANTALTNSALYHASQVSSNTVSSTRTSTWTSTIVFQSVYQWVSSARKVNYFNLGGKLSGALSYPAGSYTYDNLLWANLINAANVQLANNPMSSLSNTTGLPFTFRLAEIEDIWIEIAFSEIDSSTVSVELRFVVGATPRSSNLAVTASIINQYSIGGAGPAPYGIPAPQPSIQTYNINDGGTSGPSPTRVLRASPTNLAYAFPSQLASDPQTITLTNDGNVILTVSNIAYTSVASGITATPVYSWGSPASTTIAAGASKTFTVAYSGTIDGPYPKSFSNAIVISSDDDIGDVNIPVTQTVSKPVFDFTLTPSTWVTTSNSRNSLSQTFTILAINELLIGYYATLSGSTTGFSLDYSGPYGPKLVFYPGALSSGTYTTTLNVTASGESASKTRSASVSITYTQSASYNLGNWLSAPAKNNSIVGVSYDVIDGVRTVTLGVGGGAENIPQLSQSGGVNAQGLANYVFASNLGYDSDSASNTGVALYYRMPLASTHPFLASYGVWVRYQTKSPVSTTFNRVYSISVPTSGNYTWQFSADSSSYFYIGGQLVGDLRYTLNPHTQMQTGSIYLDAGTSNISFVVTSNSDIVNLSNGIAIRLINTATGAEIWSTRTPIRQSGSATPYPFWSEVYRIPLTGSPATYQCYQYCVKDYGFAYGLRYGTYFGTSGGSSVGSLFTVTDDGYGNVGVNVNSRSLLSNIPELDTTTLNISYSSYFYEDVAGVERYSQLAGPEGNGTQTRFFVGFYNTGVVRTNLVTYPGYVYTPVVDVGGAGGNTNPSTVVAPSDFTYSTDGLAKAQADIDAAAALADAMANAISGADTNTTSSDTSMNSVDG